MSSVRRHYRKLLKRKKGGNVKSKQFTLNEKDLRSLGRGLLITLAGAVLTWVSVNIGKVDFGTYTPFIVPVVALLVNSGLKFVDGK